jgi:hypothetical protein
MHGYVLQTNLTPAQRRAQELRTERATTLATVRALGDAKYPQGQKALADAKARLEDITAELEGLGQ